MSSFREVARRTTFVINVVAHLVFPITMNSTNTCAKFHDYTISIVSDEAEDEQRAEQKVNGMTDERCVIKIPWELVNKVS